VHLGSRSYDAVGRLDGKETALLLLYARPGANNLDVKNAAVARLNELSRAFPAGVRYQIPFDTTPHHRLDGGGGDHPRRSGWRW